MWRELGAVAVIVVAVVVRGWPRRRSDRWSFSFKLDRDRSDATKAEDERSDPDVPPEV